MAKITASDFNAISTTLGSLYGVGAGDRGYGQTTLPIPTVNVGEKSTAVKWTQLRALAQVVAAHQGTTVTLPTFTAGVGNKHTLANVSAMQTAGASLVSNRLTAAASGEIATSPPGGGHFFEEGGHTWGVPHGITSLRGIYAFDFGDEDKARAFFNSGGSIGVLCAMEDFSGNSTVTSVNDADWADIVSNKVGLVQVSAYTTVNSGSRKLANPSGYYAMQNGDFTVRSTLYNGKDLGSQGDGLHDFYIDGWVSGKTGVRGGNGSIFYLHVQAQDQSGQAVEGNMRLRLFLYRSNNAVVSPLPTMTVQDYFGS